MVTKAVRDERVAEVDRLAPMWLSRQAVSIEDALRIRAAWDTDDLGWASQRMYKIAHDIACDPTRGIMSRWFGMRKYRKMWREVAGE